MTQVSITDGRSGGWVGLADDRYSPLKKRKRATTPATPGRWHRFCVSASIIVVVIIVVAIVVFVVLVVSVIVIVVVYVDVVAFIVTLN
uniref:Transmembrane protein n=1 Tax=Angiostrongylus cantonensis TaxID=6313 RepID=A0A0K0DN48_ANGCA